MKRIVWLLLYTAVVFGIVGCGGGGSKKNAEKVISGIVATNVPLQNATIRVYRPDGSLVETQTTTDGGGVYRLHFKDSADYFIVEASGGTQNGKQFNGSLSAVCMHASCNITPLTTLGFDYFSSLLDKDAARRYGHTVADMSAILGIAKDDINKVGAYSGFDIDSYVTEAQKYGDTVLVAKLMTDMSDGYLDEHHDIFPQAKKRVAQPVPQSYEQLSDENNNPIVLTVTGVDGSQTTKGYLVDTVASRKVTVVDDDYQEIVEDQTVFLSFNAGEWRGKLNTETTVLAKLFMSDMDLLLLPESAKVELVHELKSRYKDGYEKALDLYRFVVSNGAFYNPLFEKQLNQLVGDAQNILIHSSGTKQVRMRSLQKSVLFAKAYRQQHPQKTLRDYALNSTLSIDYDSTTHKMKIINALPVYYGLRPDKPDYGALELFASPLVAPSELGAAGLMIKDIDWLRTFTEYVTNKESKKKTEFEGDQFDPQMFPYIGSDPVNGRKEYQFYKEFGVNMPTVMNVSLGIKIVLDFISGPEISKNFKTALKNLRNNPQNIKKYLSYADDFLDGISNFIEINYFLFSPQKNVKQDIIDQSTLVNIGNWLHSAEQGVNNLRAIFKQAHDLIPDVPIQSVPIRKKVKFFFKKLSFNSEHLYMKNRAIAFTLNQNQDGEITNKQALSIILNGYIVKKVYESYKNNNYATGKNAKVQKAIEEFEHNYNVSIGNYSVMRIFGIVSKNEALTLKLFKEISASGKDYEQSIRDFTWIGFMIWKNDPERIKSLMTNSLEVLLKPADILKPLIKITRSPSKILDAVSDYIVDTFSKMATSLPKTILSSATKQVAYMFTGAKVIQIANVLNEVSGLVYGIGATPSVVPFAMNVNGGSVSFDYPSIKAVAAENNVVPLSNGRSTKAFRDENGIIPISSEQSIFQPENAQNRSLFIVTSRDNNQVLYDLSYRILFSNTTETLKRIYARWDSDNAITAHLSIRKYPNDDLKREPVTFGSDANEATWVMSADEVADALQPFGTGSVIDIIDVLKKQNAGFLKRLLGMGDASSTVVQNRTRGIFRESFQYNIYEPSTSNLDGKKTEIDYFDRKVFKVENAKEMRKKLHFYKYDSKFNAIQNLTGHAITVIGWGHEWKLEDGMTVKILKTEKVRIVDAIVTQYGENQGLKSTDATIAYLIAGRMTDYVTTPSSAAQAPSYKFILSVDDNSDFADQKPQLNPANNSDYDGDGLSDYSELYETFTNPYNPDSDNDGLNDSEEINTYYTNPYSADSDGDRLNDWQEINVYHYDPNNRDTDGDGIDDLTDIITIAEQELKKNTISGKVTTPDGTPLANVTVKFEYIKNDQSTSVQDVTGVDGTYRMEFSKKDFDNIRDNAKLIVYAYADGYVPKTREITKTDQENFNEDFILEPIKPNEIVLEIEPHLHHLGDGNYTGSANSEFQRAGAESTEFSKTFFIDDFQYNNFKRAKVTFEAKGVQNYNDRLIINDYSTSLQSSPDDGSYGTQSFTIDKSEYHPGENEIKITSGYTTDFDDFEFINVKITFIDPDEPVVVPLVTYFTADTNLTSNQITLTTYFDSNNASAIDFVYWQITNPSGVSMDKLYNTEVNYLSGNSTWRVSLDNSSFFNADGDYIFDTYVINEEGIKSALSSFTKKLDVTNATSIDHKTLVQDDGWRAKISVDTLRVGEQSATIDYRKVNCGGYLIYLQEDNNGYAFDEVITYGNCGLEECQFWISADGTKYEHYCNGTVYEGNLREQQ